MTDMAAAASLLNLSLSDNAQGPGIKVTDGSGDNQAHAEFLQLCISNGVTQQAMQILLNNGVNSITILTVLKDGDLENLGLGLGQLRLIQAIHSLATPSTASTVHPPPTTPHHNTANAGTSDTGHKGDQAAAAPLGRETLRHLGLANTGEKANYHRIPDFVTLLPKDRDEVDPDIVLPTGHKISISTGTSALKKPKLSTVSPFQWMDASMRILGKMIIQNTIQSMEQVAQYAGYVSEIAQLGQNKHWPSVVMYDDSYREAQSIEAFGWGMRDLRDKRDLILEPKRSKEARDPDASTTSNTGSASSNPGKGRNRRKAQVSTPNKDESGDGDVRICRSYNAGNCARAQCRYRHWCSKCGSSAHAAVTHPN